ncbi:MAG: glycosyltransferase, partial [Planctomycetota bacterium]
ALWAGIERSRGRWVMTMDGDLQDSVVELEKLWQKARQESLDMVVGWRRGRRDSWGKVLVSRVYNALLRVVGGPPLHDINAGMRLFRRDCLDENPFYGDQYRLLPFLLHVRGYRVGEVVVEHFPRRFGRSKYGTWRCFTGLLDVGTVLFLSRFQHRPLHFFGTVGAFLFLVGLGINGYIVYLRFSYGSIQFRYPLLILGVLAMVIGIQLLSTGFLAEFIAGYLHQNRRGYSVAEWIDCDETAMFDD